MLWILKRTVSISESTVDRNQVHLKREKFVEIVRKQSETVSHVQIKTGGEKKPHRNEKFKALLFFIAKAKVSD